MPPLPPEIVHNILAFFTPDRSSWQWVSHWQRDQPSGKLDFSRFLNLRLVSRLFDEVILDIFLAAIRAGAVGRDMPLRRGLATPSTMAMGCRILACSVQRHQQDTEQFNRPLIRTIIQGVEGATALFAHSSSGDSSRSGSDLDEEGLRRSYLTGLISVLVGILGTDIIITILAGGPDLEELDEEKGEVHAAVLMTAAYLGRLDHIAQLLGLGVDVRSDPGDKWVYPPVMAAALAGHVEVVKYLVDRGADWDMSTDGNADSILHFAALTGHVDLIQLSLENGVEPDVRNNDGDTPLHFAAGGGHARAVRELVSTGKVDVDRRDHWDVAPVDWASARGYDKVLEELLRRSKVDMNIDDEMRRTI